MLKEHFKVKIRPNHILAVLFLFYIFYTGFAAIPEFLNHTKDTLQNFQGIRSYIRQTNDYYAEMFEADTEYPLLKDKGTYVNLNGLMANLLDQPEMNGCVTLKNGHLGFLSTTNPAPEEQRKAAQNVIRFHDAHTATGGNFLFVMVSSQISKYEDLLPEGYLDTTNDAADDFLTMLEEAGVPCLDLREEMHMDGISVSDIYYITDHHWTPQAGFWAYGKMLDKLAEIGAIDPVDSFYTDPENYTLDVHENSFIGSSGKRTGIYYAGVDDATVIRPNFDTEITVRVPQRELELFGPYEKVGFNYKEQYDYQNPNYFQDDFYGLYGWDNMKITHWRNEQAPQQGKFLLIGDSYGNIPFSLMSIYLSSCDEMDLRYYDGDFAAHYASYLPDTIILQISVGSTVSEFTTHPFLG